MLERHRAKVKFVKFEHKDTWEAIDVALTLEDGRDVYTRYFGPVAKARLPMDSFCEALGCDNPEAGTMKMYGSLLSDRVQANADVWIEADIGERKYMNKKGDDVFVPAIGPMPAFHKCIQHKGVEVLEEPTGEPLFDNAIEEELLPKAGFPKGSPDGEFDFELPF